MQSIDTSAVTNVAVTPAAKPCNVIAGRKYIGGSDSELLVRYRTSVDTDFRLSSRGEGNLPPRS